MPIYEFKCKECGKISEQLCKVGEKILSCLHATPTQIPGLMEKCEGSVERIASIFFIHDSWKWMLVSEDGMAYIKDPGEPTDYLYESADEEEYYLGPDHDEEWTIDTVRWSDGVRWDQREEWLNDNYDFDTDKEVEEDSDHEEE